VAKKTVTFKQEQQAAIDKNQITTPGLEVNAGQITTSEFDSIDHRTLMQDYTDMRNGDSIASTALDILKLPIMQSEMRIDPGRAPADGDDRTQEAAQYIEWALNSIKGGFDNFKYHQLLALDYGHIVFEKVRMPAKYNGKPTIIYARLSPIQFEAIEDYYYTDTMDFKSIRHRKVIPNGFTEFIDIDAADLYVYTHNQEFRDVRGRSELRPSRLAFMLKQKILVAGARGIQRATGLPVITVHGTVDPVTEGKAHTIGRTIANSENAYVIEESDKITVRLESLQNQDRLIDMLSYLDRQQFFNTLSQFMTSGLGENGSRAATSELKSSYELKAQSVLQEFEKHMQTLVDELIDMSYLAFLPQEQRPVFHLGAITQADLTAVATNLKNLADGGLLHLTPDDESVIRDMFGMPEMKEQSEVDSEHVMPENAAAESLHLSTKNDKPMRELTDHEAKVFEFESANNTFMTTQEQAQKIIDEMADKMIADAVEQLQANPNADVEIRYKRELFNKLSKLYEQAFEQGQGDMLKEVKKIGKISTELALTPDQRKRVNRKLQRALDSYYNKVSVSINATMDRLSDVNIAKKGGLRKVITPLIKDGQKMAKRTLITETQAGYTDGRADTMKELSSEIESYSYSAVFDGNLCDKCAPYDAVVLTVDEITDAGLNFESPVNPDCLGQDKCRCQWIPFKLQSEV
jgi:hypothetical protein